jgi:predicted secreted hydrolase
MKISVLALFMAMLAFAAGELALPGYRFQFPRDFFNHETYDTEWWYYTGNVTADDGHEFGFEVTFFRAAADPAKSPQKNEVWDAKSFYIAHFAISDLTGQRFYHQERLNRPGPGLAGLDPQAALLWNGNWQVRWLAFNPVEQELQAIADGMAVKLRLHSQKPVVLHGANGVSVKGPLPGEASHYFSLTRNSASGEIKVGEKSYPVRGTAWMDREFFSTIPGHPTPNWDWVSAQLNNGTELMLFRLRLEDDSVSPFSSGSYIAADGRTQFLKRSDIVMEPGRTWHSAQTGGDYPVEWSIAVPGRNLKLHLTTPLVNQELTNKATQSYWEGSVRFEGKEGATAVKGKGYLEMTGYDHRKKHGPSR